jgi:hypothetical protein
MIPTQYEGAIGIKVQGPAVWSEQPTKEQQAAYTTHAAEMIVKAAETWERYRTEKVADAMKASGQAIVAHAYGEQGHVGC